MATLLLSGEKMCCVLQGQVSHVNLQLTYSELGHTFPYGGQDQYIISTSVPVFLCPVLCFPARHLGDSMVHTFQCWPGQYEGVV